MSLKKFIPAPVKNVLRPYKEKIKRMQARVSIARGHKSKTSDSELQRKMRAFSQKYGDRYLSAMLERGWCNPGHMFDELGEIFSTNNKLFLVGSKADVERLIKKLGFMGVEIESLSLSNPIPLDMAWVAEHTEGEYTVIIGYQDTALASSVADWICMSGKFFRNVNLFLEANFVGDLVPGPEMYCGIYSVYTSGKVYLIHNNMLVTTLCNLNCEFCLNYTPYIKKPKHFPLQELKNCVDIYFSHVDYAGLFQLTGGEPLLYPYLREIIDYIFSKYREQIGILCFVTNGSIVPDDEFIEFCRNRNIFIFLDNYIDAIPRLKSSFDKLLSKIKNAGIQYNIPDVKFFVKTFPPLRSNISMDESGLKNKYRKCHIGVQNLRDGKISSCTYHAFAVNAGLIPDSPENAFDMSIMDGSIIDKRRLVEFRFGFNEKGYTDWCRYCNGHITINHNHAAVAEQVKGKLEWNRDDPTFLD